jgi:hypothetical protein
LENHESTCRKRNKSQSYVAPKEGSDVKFIDFHSKIGNPFYIAADCESYFIPNPQAMDINSKTINLNQHKIMAIGYKVITTVHSLIDYFEETRLFIMNENTNFINEFIDSLTKDMKKISDYFDSIDIQNLIPPLYSITQKELIESKENCFFCDKEFSNDKIFFNQNYNLEKPTFKTNNNTFEGLGSIKNEKNMAKIPLFHPFFNHILGAAHCFCYHKYLINNLKIDDSEKKKSFFPKYRYIPFYFHNFAGKLIYLTFRIRFPFIITPIRYIFN